MRKLNKILLPLLIGCSALFWSACGGGGGGSNPNQGFNMLTYAQGQIIGSIVPTAGNVQGQFLNGAGTYGTVTSFNTDHSGVGLLNIAGAKVPGTWRLALGPGLVQGSLCLTYNVTDRNVRLGSQESLICPGRFVGFNATPASLDALNPPATIVFSGGKGLDNAYGEPALAFYDEFGYVVASTQASQSLWSGGEIEGIAVSVPDISQVYDGVYIIVIHNVRADGGWDVIGAAPVTIYGNPPPPPPPPPGGGDCEPAPPELPQLPCEQQQQ